MATGAISRLSAQPYWLSIKAQMQAIKILFFIFFSLLVGDDSNDCYYILHVDDIVAVDIGIAELESG